MTRRLSILGTRGIPAAHGGFETFAERLAPYLVSRGWEVSVYCQQDVPAAEAAALSQPRISHWRGVRQVTFSTRLRGAPGTISFDLRSARHAVRAGHLTLTLGYNTAVFGLLQRMAGISNLVNMDGIEWRRDKWAWYAKAWLFVNERLAAWSGTHLIADHPQIAARLRTLTRADRITMIPYGADALTDEDVDPAALAALALVPGEFLTVIARPEPENSILEIVSAFSRSRRGCRLVVLGDFDDNYPYHAAVKAAASGEVTFPGAIYEHRVVNALRRYSRAYVHGHRVGGTNPSLVEALGAGCAVIAQDNHFNRWVAGERAQFFRGADDLATLFDRLLDDGPVLRALRDASVARHRERFTWERVLGEYEALLARYADEQVTAGI
jgi:glycosyltransferase involved in cell wall biosynthesis